MTSPNVPTLPTETVRGIVAELPVTALKQLRLCSKSLCTLATPYCFQRIRLNLISGTPFNLLAISRDDRLRHHVKRLIFISRLGLPRFESFDEWELCVNRKSGRFLLENAAPGLISSSEWKAMSKEARQKLYEEYRRDASDQKFRANKLLRDSLRQLMRMEVYNLRAMRSLDEAHGSIPDLLAHAVAKFDNLKSVSYEVAEPHYSHLRRWRGLPIFPIAAGLRAHETAQNLDALQISIILNAVGRAKIHNASKVRSMHLSIPGPAFWGHEYLYQLWSGAPRSIYRSAAWQLTLDSIGERSPRTGWRHIKRRMLIIEQSFANLTRLSLCIDTENYYTGDADYSRSGVHIFNFLSQSPALRTVTLVLIEITRTRPDSPTERYIGDKVLTMLTRNAPWPKLRQLCLAITTSADTLIRLTDSMSDSLHDLSFVCTSLTQGCWEDVLDHFARQPNLVDFFASQLADYNTPEQKIRCILGTRRYQNYVPWQDRVVVRQIAAVQQYVRGQTDILIPLDRADFIKSLPVGERVMMSTDIKASEEVKCMQGVKDGWADDLDEEDQQE